MSKKVFGIVGIALLCITIQSAVDKSTGSLQAEETGNSVNPISAYEAEGNGDYTDCMDAYKALLFQNAYIMEGDVKISIWPIDGSMYAIHDMNDDGIPELLVSSVVERYEAEENDVWTVIDSSIYSFCNGEVYEWYAGNGCQFQLLEDNSIYTKYQSNDGSKITYFVKSFDTNGDVSIDISFEESININGSVSYSIDGKSVEQAAWEIEKEKIEKGINHDCWIKYTE